MRHFQAYLLLLRTFFHPATQCAASASEFHLEGDYLMGGLFDVHNVEVQVSKNRPEAIDCSSHSFVRSSYRRLQLMRFSVEQINNSTSLLPDVSLGYEIFDHCSDTYSFPGILSLISVNGSINPWTRMNTNLSAGSRVIGVVGPFSSTDTLTTGPLFMSDLIPLVSYGAASSAFSKKTKFPSFLRTVNSNKGVIQVIVEILLHFKWHWVAFLNSDNDFGNDGLELFRQKIENTDICLAYTKVLSEDTNHHPIFKQIEDQKVNVIVVFTTALTAEALIESAIRLNITNKVWVAGDTWSLNHNLPTLEGIQNIGTVLGVSQPVVTIPGFREFIYSITSQSPCEKTQHTTFCNQACSCSGLTPEDIISMDPSFSFPVYSAVYSIAHALHNVLQCGVAKCNDNITVYPHMVLAELKKSNFTLLNQTIQFDVNGDPKFGSYSVVFWNHRGDAQEIGFYKLHPSTNFFINSSEIQWYTGGEVPTSICSSECAEGYRKKQDGIHKCCFDCLICRNGTFVNVTEDPYSCVSCSETEWSAEGSTSCSLRLVEFVPFSDPGAIVIMVAASALVALTLAVSVLFAINYNTPVVRSAGGPMCFLILGCLSLSSLSVFSHFGQPTLAFCILRFFPFVLFYTVCLACFVVRSFQIVCVFKMAAKFPRLYSWWMKYHGQWLIITVAFGIQALLLVIGYSLHPPHPYNETLWYQDQIILGCDVYFKAGAGAMMLPVILCSLCFIFSYMGKDLPKNYNEAKSITFCLLLLVLTWIVFAAEYLLYHSKYIQTLNALAIISSLYSFLLWYFLPKCLIIVFQPQRNTQQYFQGLIQNYTKTISQ